MAFDTSFYKHADRQWAKLNAHHNKRMAQLANWGATGETEGTNFDTVSQSRTIKGTAGKLAAGALLLGAAYAASK